MQSPVEGLALAVTRLMVRSKARILKCIEVTEMLDKGGFKLQNESDQEPQTHRTTPQQEPGPQSRHVGPV